MFPLSLPFIYRTFHKLPPSPSLLPNPALFPFCNLHFSFPFFCGGGMLWNSVNAFPLLLAANTLSLWLTYFRRELFYPFHPSPVSCIIFSPRLESWQTDIHPLFSSLQNQVLYVSYCISSFSRLFSFIFFLFTFAFHYFPPLMDEIIIY